MKPSPLMVQHEENYAENELVIPQPEPILDMNHEIEAINEIRQPDLEPQMDSETTKSMAKLAKNGHNKRLDQWRHNWLQKTEIMAATTLRKSKKRTEQNGRFHQAKQK
jgi:hypothetical protein